MTAERRACAASPSEEAPACTAWIMVCASPRMAPISSAKAGGGDPPVGRQMRAADQRHDGRGIEGGGMAFRPQVDHRLAGSARMLRRRLQRAHAHLDAIIGRQTLRDEGRQRQIGLSELFDDL